MTTAPRAAGGVAIVAFATLLGGMTATAAGAAGPASWLGADVQAPTLVHGAQYRGRYNDRRYGGYQGNRYRRNDGRNLALGIGALIIGGIVLSESARSEHRRPHVSAWERCAQTYRSFEPDTGMYTGYDGERHSCPYLR